MVPFAFVRAGLLTLVIAMTVVIAGGLVTPWKKETQSKLWLVTRTSQEPVASVAEGGLPLFPPPSESEGPALTIGTPSIKGSSRPGSKLLMAPPLGQMDSANRASPGSKPFLGAFGSYLLGFAHWQKAATLCGATKNFQGATTVVIYSLPEFCFGL